MARGPIIKEGVHYSVVGEHLIKDVEGNSVWCLCTSKKSFPTREAAQNLCNNLNSLNLKDYSEFHVIRHVTKRGING
jgi:hypothetical protein